MTPEEIDLENLIQDMARLLGCNISELDRDRAIIKAIDLQVQALRQRDGLVADRLRLVTNRYLQRR